MKLRFALSWLSPRVVLFAASLPAASLPLTGKLAAADARTEMAPFKVEAEFGIDGLRIQNATSVLNQYLLEQHGVAQLQDISGVAPNLYSSNSDSRGFGDVLSLRGVANSIFFSSPSIALYVDDVPSGSVSSYPSSLLNIESFTVKAGPQGTDYGRNAPGGVIDIRSRVPGAKHQGKVLVDVSEFQAVGVQAAFDGPVNDVVGYSASLGYNEREGYIENTLRSRSEDDRSAFAGRGALYFKPDESLQLRFGLLVEKVEDEATRLSSLLSPNPYAVSSDLAGETKIDRLQFSFQLKKTLDWATLVATTSRQDWDLDPSLTDLDLSPLPLASSRVVQNERNWTQEVRFESLPGAGRPQWRAGVFFIDSETESEARRQFVVPPSQFVPPDFIQTEQTSFQSGQTSFAGYGNSDIALTKETTLRLGVRVERAESKLVRDRVSSNNFGFPSPPDPRIDRRQEEYYFSASGGVVHTLSESLSLQARSALAQKPAGFSGFTSNPQLARYDQERIWANELGLTFGPPKGRFGGSILGFWNLITDYQFERTVPNSTDFVVVNADEVTARGVEAKFMWSPVEKVWWDFQAGYTEATFENHHDASGTPVNGKHVPFVPKYTLRTGVTVDFGHGFSGNASYAAIGRTYYDERNTSTFSQKSYGIVNAQIRYRFDRWTTALYGQNLFEEDYYQFINPEIFAGSPGAPRRFGVQVSYEY